MVSNSIVINKSYDPSIFRTIVKRFWWWPVIFMGIMCLLSFFYLRYTKPVFESNLVLQIASEDNGKEILNLETIGAGRDEYYTQLELLRSQLLFEKAIQTLNLNVSLFSRGDILTEEKYQTSIFNVIPYSLSDSSLINHEINVHFKNDKVTLKYDLNGKSYSKSAQINEHIVTHHFDVVIKACDFESFKQEANSNDLFFVFNSINSISNRMLGGLRIEPIDEAAQTINIAYRGNNALLCRDLSQAVATSFLNFADASKKKGSENVLKFLNIQLDSLSNELKKSKDSLIGFQRSENIPDPENMGTDIKSNVDGLQEELFQLDDEVSSLNNISKKLNDAPNRLEVYRLLPELLGKSFETSLATHIESLHILMEEKDDLLFRMTEESTEIRRLDKKIQEKIKLILRSVNTIESRLTAKSKVLRGKLNTMEGEFITLPGKKMEFNRLKNLQDLNEKYFQLLTEKKLLYSISDAGYSSNNRILKSAEISNDPVAPSRKLIYSSFVIFGLIIGLAVLFFKYVTYNEINRIEDLESVLPSKATIIGGIPLFQYAMEHSQLVVSEDPKSIIAEAMRKIRVNLSYIKPDFKTIAISSSISGEGKTFVALNLAGIISMSGKKTILIDLDMRKPKIHLGFNVPNNHGMSSLIIKKSTLEESIHKSVSENLDFITAGPTPPNPSELLLSNSFNSIIEELKGMYDVIVIDNPPVGLVSDGVKILTDADIPIYVFKSHYSKRNFAMRIKELFEMQQLSSLNVVLNGIQRDNKSIYGYGYGYGYGYVEEKSEKFKKLTFTEKLLSKLKRKDGNS